MTLLIYTQKQEQLSEKVILMIFIFISNIQKLLGKGSNWITDSVIEDDINISKHNLLAGSSYLKLSKELDHPKKGLINIQNIDDNECFNWCIVRYLHPADHNPSRIIKAD